MARTPHQDRQVAPLGAGALTAFLGKDEQTHHFKCSVVTTPQTA